MQVRKTDVKVAPGVYASIGALYNKKYSENTSRIIGIVDMYNSAIQNILNAGEGITIRVCPIRKKTTSGRYFSISKTVELSCKWQDTLETLAHELIHAEQYNEGRLKVEGKNPVWNNMKFNTFSPKSFNEYLNLPWEKEAFNRQKDIAEEAIRLVSYYSDGFCGS